MVARAMSWPAALPPRRVDFSPASQTRSGGQSLSGSEQIIASPAGMWKASVAVAVRGEAANLAVRAFVAQMEGRAGTVLVPKWDKYRPRDLNGRQFSQAAAAGYAGVRGDQFNFDLSGFGQGEIAYALTAEAANLRATVIKVDVLNGDGPRPGHYIGLGSRLYQCQQVWQTDIEGPVTIQFWPPLRGNVPAGARVIIDRPVVLMRFASDETGEIALSRAGSGSVSFEFVEASPGADEAVQVWFGPTAEEQPWMLKSGQWDDTGYWLDKKAW